VLPRGKRLTDATSELAGFKHAQFAPIYKSPTAEASEAELTVCPANCQRSWSSPVARLTAAAGSARFTYATDQEDGPRVLERLTHEAAITEDQSP
jgi:hypothetical protein